MPFRWFGSVISPIYRFEAGMSKASASGLEVERYPPDTRHLPLTFGHNAINPGGLGA